MQAKLIRRNATRQQAAIFSQIKSAKCVVTYGWESKESAVNDLSNLPEIYAGNRNALLLQVSEDKYQLVISEDKRYILSTKEEAIAPSTTEEATQVTQETEEAIVLTAAKYPELITRSETDQQAAIFSQVKSAKLVLTLSYCYGQKTREEEVEIEDLSELPEFYAREDQAMLLKFSETEYQIAINSGKRYILSTKEEAIAPTESTPAEMPTQSETNQKPATLKGLEVELYFAELELEDCENKIHSTKGYIHMLKNAKGEIEDIAERMLQLQAKLQHLQNEAETLENEVVELKRKIKTIEIVSTPAEEAIAKSQPKPKIDITSIELTREEDCDDDQPNHIATPIWLEANKMLYRWAKTAPKTGHQQCTAKLVFSDGNSITTPIKLNYWSFDALKSITNELDPQQEISWHEITQDDFLDYLATHKLNTKNLALA